MEIFSNVFSLQLWINWLIDVQRFFPPKRHVQNEAISTKVKV